MWVISRVIVNKILGHAQRSLPRECVGLLSGTKRSMNVWYPLTNVAEDDRSFLADPGEQIRLMQDLRAKGEQVVAIYHSHPTGPGEPSAADVEQAYDPGVLHLIVALNTEGRLDMNGFLISAGKIEAQELVVVD